MHCQRDRDNTVGEEHTDVFGNSGVAHQLGSGQRCHHEQGVEQQNTDDSLLVVCLLDVCAANQDGSNGVQADVILLLDGIEGAQILQEDQLAPCCQNGRNAGSDDTGLVHVDTGGGSNASALAHGTHILAQTGVHDPVIEPCKEADQRIGHSRNADRAVDLIDAGDHVGDHQDEGHSSQLHQLTEVSGALCGTLLDEHDQDIDQHANAAQQNRILQDHAAAAQHLIHSRDKLTHNAERQHNNGNSSLGDDLLLVHFLTLLLVMQSQHNSGEQVNNAQQSGGGQEADIVHSILQVAGQVESVTQTEAAVQQVGVVEGNDTADDVQDEQAVQTSREKAQHQAGDHLSTLGLVEQLAQQPAEEHSQRRGDQHAQHKAADTGEAPVDHPENGDLCGNRANDDTEVHAQTCHTGDDQSQDQAGVTAETGEDFACDIGNVCAGDHNTCNTQQNEQQDDLILEDKTLEAVQGTFLVQGIIAHSSEPPLACARAYRITPFWMIWRMVSEISVPASRWLETGGVKMISP